MVKIIRPVLRRAFPRERLFRLLDSMRERPVMWVCGPPGCGKTTLVNSYLDSRNIPCLWYQVDERDADPATFFYYLGQAERGFGSRREALPLFHSEYLKALPTFSLRYFENLYSRLKSPGVIVFDHYHKVPPGSSIHEVLINAISVLPEGINFIVISRGDPPADFIRLRADQMVEILGWDQIRLTLEEAGEIARMWSKTIPAEAKIADLHRASDGWLTGLMLMLDQGKIEKVEIKPGGDFVLQEVFDYFAKEFFGRAEEEVKQFLLKTSFFPQMSAPMAEELTGLPSAHHILSSLSRNNYFTEERLQVEPVFQYHPLLRRFLFAKATETLPADEILRIRRKAGKLLEQSGQLEDAAKLYRDGKDWDGLIQLILRQGRNLLNQGRFRPVQDCIRSIPPEIRENDPRLLYRLGTCQLPLEAEESIECFKKAFDLFLKEGDTPGAYVACAALVSTLTYEENDWRLLAPWVDWLTEQIRLHPSFPSPQVEARVAVSLAEALLNVRPEHPELGKWMERSLQLAREINDVNLNLRASITAAYWCQLIGDMARCSLIGEELDKMARSPSASPLLIIVKKWIEACVLNLGPTAQYDSALERVREGMQTARETGVHFWEARLLTQAVIACLNKGDPVQAGEFLQEMHASLKSTQRVVLSRYHYLSAWSALLQADYPRALANSRMALSLALEIGSSSREVLCRLEMAQILMSAGETKNAAVQLNLAGKLIPRCGSSNLEFSYLLAKARLSLEEEEEWAGLKFLRKAMALGRSRGYVSIYYWWDPQGMSRLCAQALAAGIEAEYVRHLIRKRKLLPDPLSRGLENWPWPLKISTLGSFVLEREGKRLVFPGKAPQKALLLLKVLAALGGKEIREEQITDLLWPESEGDAAHIGFKTLLSRLRQLLEVKDAIHFQEGKASLNPAACWVDVCAFEEIVSQAKRAWDDKSAERSGKAAALTEKALTLYQGSFLQGEENYDWISPPRERLRRKFLFLVCRLGENLGQNQKWREAVEIYLNALDVEPLPEEFYQNLMTCYLQLGQSNEGIAVYQRLRKMISDGGQLAPSRKTDAIYQSLLKTLNPPAALAA